MADFRLYSANSLLGFRLLYVTRNVLHDRCNECESERKSMDWDSCFFVIQYLISLIETSMFDHKNITLERAFRFEVTDEATKLNNIETSQYVLGLLPTLFEAVIIVILVFAIVKLVKKRVES